MDTGGQMTGHVPMALYLTLLSVALTSYSFTEAAMLTSNKQYSQQLASAESLWPTPPGMEKAGSHQPRLSQESQLQSSAKSVVTNNNTGFISRKQKPKFQNGTISRRMKACRINKIVTSVSTVKNTPALQVGRTDHVVTRRLIKGKRVFIRKQAKNGGVRLCLQTHTAGGFSPEALIGRRRNYDKKQTQKSGVKPGLQDHIDGGVVLKETGVKPGLQDHIVSGVVLKETGVKPGLQDHIVSGVVLKETGVRHGLQDHIDGDVVLKATGVKPGLQDHIDGAFTRKKTGVIKVPQDGIFGGFKSESSTVERINYNRNHVHKREIKSSQYISNLSVEDNKSHKNVTNTTEGEKRYKHRNNNKKVAGNQTLTYEIEKHRSALVPIFTSADMYAQDMRYGESHRECACHKTLCDYSYCQLTSVPARLTPNVTELLLGYNDIRTLKENAFSRYILLEILVLSGNRIHDIEEGAFNGLTRLISLNLNDNSLGNNTKLSERIFEPLTALKILRLGGNDFPCNNSPPYLDVYLAYLHSVEELYIDNYGNQLYGPGFRNLTSLRNVTFICLCSIKQLPNKTFTHLGQITFLNVSSCGIRGISIEKGSFAPLKNLKTLDISSNKVITMDYLPSILWGLKDSSLETLNMDLIVDDYSLNYINSSITEYLPRTLTRLSSRENSIMSLDRDGFMKLPQTLKFIDLSNNYMVMKPGYYPLEMLNELEVLLVNTDLKQCITNSKLPEIPQRNELVLKKLTNAKRETVETGQLIDNRSGGNKIPKNLKYIQLNVKSLHETYLLYLDRNNSLEKIDLRCSTINDFNFLYVINFPHLKYLNLGRSSVLRLSFPIKSPIPIPPIRVLILESNNLNDFLRTTVAPFRGLGNLTYLDLSFNKINHVRLDLFDGLDSLEYVQLDGNTFSSFNANISNMEQLKLLNLSNTGLSYLPNHVRSEIDHLCQIKPGQITVDMSGCPVQCDCLNLDFLKWMVKSPAFDQNFTGYQCRYADTSVKEMTDGYEETIRNLDRVCAQNYPVFLTILAATLVLLCAVTGAIVYRFRWKIRYLYYAAYLKVMDRNKQDREHVFTYDVFLSYDSQDQAYVRRYLSPELEKRGLKLLVHTRDFVAGTYIASNIVMAVADSRKTLVILTRNLVESTWCNYEIQMATMEAVHTGRQVLMFLLKENIPNQELDVELLRHIKNNTYIPYPGPEDEADEEAMGRFYDKLAHDLRC